jgi:hypothetical protein
MKLMSDIKKKFWPNDALDLTKPRLLRHRCLVGSLFQGSYTSIFIYLFVVVGQVMLCVTSSVYIPEVVGIIYSEMPTVYGKPQRKKYQHTSFCLELVSRLCKLFVPDNYLRVRRHKLHAIPTFRTTVRARSPLVRGLSDLNIFCHISTRHWKWHFCWYVCVWWKTIRCFVKGMDDSNVLFLN